MLTHPAAIVKDKNKVTGTFNVVELDSGSQRLEHGKSAFYFVNVSQCPNTDWGNRSESVDLSQLIRVQRHATNL